MNLDRLIEFVKSDDMTFYEEHILNLPMEKQKQFLIENPDFLEEYFLKIGDVERLQDQVYRDACRLVKKAEDR